MKLIKYAALVTCFSNIMKDAYDIKMSLRCMMNIVGMS